jgi:signal transduction histidine kinase
LFDAGHLKEPILKHALQQHLSPENTSWLVKGGDGRTLLTSEHIPTGSLTVRANFAGNFPNWTLELYHEGPQLFETFLTSRRGIYFYMFLLIGGILIFGLILTIRTVNHELELAKMKSDFVSTVTHELKSPLTSIRQLAEMLQTGRVPSEERRRKYYDILLEQSERLCLLTENVLNFARMEEGKQEFEFVESDVGMLLNKIVPPIRHRLGHEEFEIELQTDNSLPPVLLDSEAIAQAVTNLIDNAVKYSGNSKTVLVKTFRENGHLVIAVQDFGVGIKREELDRVFDRFYRGGDALTRTVRGSGLGLTLVKQIVEAHRGTVTVESDPGSGSTFSIRVPFK